MHPDGFRREVAEAGSERDVMRPEDWDARYEEASLLWSTGPNRFVDQLAGQLPPGSALDVACGEGRNAVWLASNGWEVTGVDFSAVALERARHMAREAGVEVSWVQADITEWMPGRTFDLVLVAYVHLPPADRNRLMQKVVSWVESGGHLLVVGHDVATAGVSGPSDPDLLWSPALARKLAAPLEVVVAEQRSRETADGSQATDTVLLARRSGGGDGSEANQSPT